MVIKKIIVLALAISLTSGCGISANSFKVFPQNSQTAELQDKDFGKCEELAKEKSDYNRTMESRTWASSSMILMLGPFGLLSVLAGATHPRAGLEMDAIKTDFDIIFSKCMTDRGYEVSKQGN